MFLGDGQDSNLHMALKPELPNCYTIPNPHICGGFLHYINWVSCLPWVIRGVHLESNQN